LLCSNFLTRGARRTEKNRKGVGGSLNRGKRAKSILPALLNGQRVESGAEERIELDSSEGVLEKFQLKG